MMQANTLLEKVIDDSILEIRTDYSKNKWRYLSESDVVCMIFSRLERRLSDPALFPPFGPLYYSHAEIRPYIVDGCGTLVLKEGDDGAVWVRKGDGDSENGSGRIDLVVIRGSNGYDEARDKAIKLQWKDDVHEDLKYARILSYPLASLEAVIEVKVKVRMNKKRVLTDLKKLDAIKVKRPGCIARMVVFDHCAQESSPENVREIEKAVEGLCGRVRCHSYYGGKEVKG